MRLLYDSLKQISLSFLNKNGYLKPDQRKSGSLIWSINGNQTGSIGIKVNTLLESAYLELDYKCNQISINYRVPLIAIPSNLGKGVVWFFVCPYTGKIRILYWEN